MQETYDGKHLQEENKVGSRKSWKRHHSVYRSDVSERDRMGEGPVVHRKYLGCSAVLRKVQAGHWGKVVCQRDMKFPENWLPYYSCGIYQEAAHKKVALAQVRKSGGPSVELLPATRDLGGLFLHP